MEVRKFLDKGADTCYNRTRQFVCAILSLNKTRAVDTFILRGIPRL